MAANAMGVVTYDSDPGRLSAAFVWDLFQRVTAPRAPAVRYVVGGWPAVIDRMVARAPELGVRIETSSRVDALPEPRSTPETADVRRRRLRAPASADLAELAAGTASSVQKPTI